MVHSSYVPSRPPPTEFSPDSPSPVPSLRRSPPVTHQPFAQYTLAYTFLVPTACWLAVALVASMLIFPETHSRTWTRDLVDSFLVPVLQRSQAHSKLLATAPPTQESSADWMALSPALESTQHKMSASLEALLGGLMFVKLEVSRGRLGAKDLASIAGKLSKLASSSMGLGVVFRTVARQHRVRGCSLGYAASTDTRCSSSAGSVKERHLPLPTPSPSPWKTNRARKLLQITRLLVCDGCAIA